MSGPRFLPYGRQTIEEEDRRAVLEVLSSDWLTQGPAVERFESALAERCGARHAVAVANGTAALHLAALVAGIEPGDRVLTSPITFVATANCIVHAGGEPGFVDVEPDSANVDPDAFEARVREGRGRVRGVIPVDFAGCPAAMERIASVARENGLFVIEDASHAIGASWTDSRGAVHPVGDGSHADLTTFSFHPVKHVTTGEGGAVLTNRDDLADRLRSLRTHGIVREAARLERDEGGWWYEMQDLGFNYRITDLQCALGTAQLGRLSVWVERRAALVARYRKALAGVEEVRFNVEPQGVRPAWHLFVVRVPDRGRVYRELREQGIGVQVHYIPVHLQPYYRRRFGTREGDFPVAEAFYRDALSLPLFPSMRDEDADRVVEALLRAIGRTA